MTHTRYIFSLLLIITLLFVAPMYVSAAEWPGWRGPEGNGISTETSLNPDAFENGLTLSWRAQVGIGYSSVAVANGFVYTMGNVGNEDTVYALDADTGSVVWSYSYRCSLGGYPGPRATPLVVGSRLYTLSREGHVFCFDTTTGDVLWAKHLQNDYRMSSPQWGFAGSPVLYKDTIIFNAGESGIALDASNGSVAWTSKRGRGSYAAPVLYPYSGGIAVAIFGERAIHGVDADSGRLLWTHPWPTNSAVNAADPVISGSQAFIASAYNHGSALIDFSGRNTREVWSSKTFSTHFSSFVLIDGRIYGNDGDARRPSSGTFRCMDFETGEVLWSERAGFGSLIAVGGYLITLDYKGSISIVRASDQRFERLGTVDLPRSQFWTPPAYADGFLYCRDTKGNLYRVDMR